MYCYCCRVRKCLESFISHQHQTYWKAFWKSEFDGKEDAARCVFIHPSLCCVTVLQIYLWVTERNTGGGPLQNVIYQTSTVDSAQNTGTQNRLCCFGHFRSRWPGHKLRGVQPGAADVRSALSDAVWLPEPGAEGVGDGGSPLLQPHELPPWQRQGGSECWWFMPTPNFHIKYLRRAQLQFPQQAPFHATPLHQWFAPGLFLSGCASMTRQPMLFRLHQTRKHTQYPVDFMIQDHPGQGWAIL